MAYLRPNDDEDGDGHHRSRTTVTEINPADSSAPPCIRITVHVLDKQVPVSCGGGTQRIKWLGHVGIARYDEKDLQGWRTLGIPLTVARMNGEELDMGSVIRDVLRDKDSVIVTTSLKPPDHKS